MKITTEQAVNHLSETLKTDPDFLLKWKTNLATSYKEEFKNSIVGYKNSEFVEGIADRAAINFIDQLIIDLKPSEKTDKTGRPNHYRVLFQNRDYKTLFGVTQGRIPKYYLKDKEIPVEKLFKLLNKIEY